MFGRYMQFLVDKGFNAIRFPFNHQSMLSAEPIELPGTLKAKTLRGLTYPQMFLRLAQHAAKHGILVMLTCHRTTPGAWPGDGLWYDKDISEEDVLDSWDIVADELCAQWNVFAADLQNEPSKASWGKGRNTDWDKAAERIGNHVLSKCPRWLIMVEGVGYNPGAPHADDASMGFWWGENLVGVKVAPVTLSDQKRLVYSPHSYGPSVYMHEYFEEENFPHNMDAIWNSHFGFAKQATGQAIVIGEMGGFYKGKDQVWQDWAIDKCRREGYGVFYFELNPDSIDTGGILKDDWTTPIDAKLRLLHNLPSTSIAGLVPEQCLCVSTPPPSPPSPSPPPLDWASLRCYAERYTDIMEGYCHHDVNNCPWPELYEHYLEHGRQEGRKMDCKPPSAPPLPLPPPPLPPPRPPPPPKPPSPPPPRVFRPPRPPAIPAPLFRRPPPAPPFMETLASVQGKPRSWGELHIEGGTASEADEPTASGVVKDLASIASASVKHQVKTDSVSFGFASAGACLLVISFLVGLCRIYRFLCRPRYAGVLDAKRVGRSRTREIDLRKVKPRRRKMDEENEGGDEGDDVDEYDEYTDDEDDDGGDPPSRQLGLVHKPAATEAAALCGPPATLSSTTSAPARRISAAAAASAAAAPPASAPVGAPPGGAPPSSAAPPRGVLPHPLPALPPPPPTGAGLSKLKQIVSARSGGGSELVDMTRKRC